MSGVERPPLSIVTITKDSAIYPLRSVHQTHLEPFRASRYTPFDSQNNRKEPARPP